MKTAVLMVEAPPQHQEDVRLRSEEIGTDYKKVMLGYVHSKKTWDSGRLVDMFIDAINKGKRQAQNEMGREQKKGKNDNV